MNRVYPDSTTQGLDKKFKAEESWEYPNSLLRQIDDIERQISDLSDLREELRYEYAELVG